jgi:ketosteroid isomerase-like protein
LSVDSPSALALAERFFDAMARGDVEAVRATYAPGASVWHNVDGVYQTVDENLRLMEWMARKLTGLHHESVRREATATGFVQEYVMRATNRSGATVELPACIIATVEDGQITALREYLDSAHAAGLFA